MIFFDISLQRANILLGNLEQKYNHAAHSIHGTSPSTASYSFIDVLYKNTTAEAEEFDILHSDLERLKHTFATDPSKHIAVPLINELLAVLPLIEEKAKTDNISLDHFYRSIPSTPEHSDASYRLVIDGLRTARQSGPTDPSTGLPDHQARVNTPVSGTTSSIAKHLNNEIYYTRDSHGAPTRRWIGKDGNYTVDLKYGSSLPELLNKLQKYGILSLSDEERVQYNLGQAPAIKYADALKVLKPEGQEKLLRTLNHLDDYEQPKLGQFKLPSFSDIQQFKANSLGQVMSLPPIQEPEPPMSLEQAAYTLALLDESAKDLNNPHPKLRFDPRKDSLLDINPNDNKIQGNEADIMHTELEMLKNTLPTIENAGLIKKIDMIQAALNRVEYESNRNSGISLASLKQIAQDYKPNSTDPTVNDFMKEISTSLQTIRAKDPNPWTRVNTPSQDDLTGDSEVKIHLGKSMHGDGIDYLSRKDLLDGLPDNVSGILNVTKDISTTIINGTWKAFELIAPGEPGDKNSPLQTVLKKMIDKGITNINSWNPKNATDTARTLDQQVVFFYNKNRFENAKAFSEENQYAFNVKYGTNTEDIVERMDFAKLTKPDGENVFYGDLLNDLSFHDKKELFKEVNNLDQDNLSAGVYRMPSYQQVIDFKSRKENKNWTPKELNDGHISIPENRTYNKYANFSKPLEMPTSPTETSHDFAFGLDDEIATINVKDGLPSSPNGAANINIKTIRDRNGNPSDIALNNGELDINTGYGRTTNINIQGKIIDAPNAGGVFNLVNSTQGATHINYDKGRVSFGSYDGGNAGKVLLNNEVVRAKITNTHGSFKYEAVANQPGKELKHDITIGLTQREGDNVGSTLDGQNMLFGGKKLGDFFGTNKTEDGDVGITGYRRQSLRISPFSRRINASMKGDKYETNVLSAKVGEDQNSATDSSVYMKGGTKRDHMTNVLEGDGNHKTHQMVLGSGAQEIAEVTFGDNSKNHTQIINLGSGENDTAKITMGANTTHNRVIIQRALTSESQDIDNTAGFMDNTDQVLLDISSIFEKQFIGLDRQSIIEHLQNPSLMKTMIGGGYKQLVYGEQFSVAIPDNFNNLTLRYGKGPDETVQVFIDPRSGQINIQP